MKTIFTILLAVTLSSCATVPEGKEAVLNMQNGQAVVEVIEINPALTDSGLPKTVIKTKDGVIFK